MEKIIYLTNDNKEEYCCGQNYFDFLDYAFEETDYFMLVYVNYYGKGYSKEMREFKKELQPYQVKTRTNPSWPGTLSSWCKDTTYKVIFYRNDMKAKDILKKVSRLDAWSRPGYPEDLAFFKGNQCWFYSVGHERIAAIIHATEKDIDFLQERGLAKKEEAFLPEDNYYEQYDEELGAKHDFI